MGFISDRVWRLPWGLGLVWFGLKFRYGLVWFEVQVVEYVCSSWFGLVWFGLVWFGLVWLGLKFRYQNGNRGVSCVHSGG